MTRFGFLLVCALATSLGAQSLTDRFKEVRGPWELQLERGEAATVRKGVEALLGREGLPKRPMREQAIRWYRRRPEGVRPTPTNHDTSA